MSASETSARPDALGQIFSFYSFKGGVGRSMALANVAVLLARTGSPVLVVDWDLEAPGLKEYFNRFDSRIDSEVAAKPGIVDILTGLRDGTRPDWRKAVINVSLRAKTGTVKFDLISAGRTGADYSSRLQNINWQELYEKSQLGEFLEHLRREWKRDYAFVLLDSRTGVTDIGDVCTVLLPDALVVFFVTNEQNLDGVQYVIDRANLVTQKLPTDRGKLVAVPVLARDEVYNEYKRAQLWRQKSAEKFEPVLRDWLPRTVTASSYFQKMFIPYVTHWSFGESLPVIENEEEIENPASVSAAYSRLATIFKSGLDWAPLAAGENPLEVDKLKTEKSQLQESIWETRRNAFIAVSVGALITIAAVAFSVYSLIRSTPESQQSLETKYRAEQKVAEETSRKQQEAELERQRQTAEAERARAQAQITSLQAAIVAAEQKLAASNEQIHQMQLQNSDLLARIAKRLDVTPPNKGEMLGR